VSGHFITYPWAAVFAVWLIGAFATKRTIETPRGAYRIVEMIGLFLAVSLLFSGLPIFHYGILSKRFLPQIEAAAWAGFAVEAAGLVFSIWARFYLGGNWSANVTLKQGHTLVRSGPYRIVRHPIYAGFLCAILGTAIAIGEWRGLLALPLAAASWHFKAAKEERLMVQQFGEEYERYRREVKSVIPFVL
jgi:protein-S-isoprenylcysteine O-methyltransferase Ste14